MSECCKKPSKSGMKSGIKDPPLEKRKEARAKARKIKLNKWDTALVLRHPSTNTEGRGALELLLPEYSKGQQSDGGSIVMAALAKRLVEDPKWRDGLVEWFHTQLEEEGSPS